MRMCLGCDKIVTALKNTVTAKCSVLKPGGYSFEVKAVAQRPLDSAFRP